MKIQIKEIELVFSEDKQQIIDKTKLMIQNNYELILSTLGNNKTIDISQDDSNFNNTFYHIVNSVYNNDNNKQALNAKELLSALHTGALIRRKKINTTTILELNPNISDEYLSALIAYKYFEKNGTFDDFVEYLKTRNNEEEIFKWLQKTSRWDTYNYLLNITSNYLKAIDEEFFKHMQYITSFWFNHIIDNMNNKDDSNKEYPKISEKEFDSLFYEFLNYINAPSEWINTYNMLKEKGLIIVEKDKEQDNSECFVDEDGITKILIGNGDNLRGFCNFAHEFSHYISKQNDSQTVPKLTVIEFPSIFLEKIAAEFLKEKGYSNEIVNQLSSNRENSNHSLYYSLFPLFNDLIRYMNHGKITKQDKINLYQHQIDSINKIKKQVLENLIAKGEKIEDPTGFAEEKVDAEKDVEEDCDLMIDAFIKEGLLIINGYQYLLDSYLAEQVLNKRNTDNTVMEKMIYVTNNLKAASVKDILTIFGIENALQKDPTRGLHRK